MAEGTLPCLAFGVVVGIDEPAALGRTLHRNDGALLAPHHVQQLFGFLGRHLFLLHLTAFLGAGFFLSLLGSTIFLPAGFAFLGAFFFSVLVLLTGGTAFLAVLGLLFFGIALLTFFFRFTFLLLTRFLAVLFFAVLALFRLFFSVLLFPVFFVPVLLLSILLFLVVLLPVLLVLAVFFLIVLVFVRVLLLQIVEFALHEVVVEAGVGVTGIEGQGVAVGFEGFLP